jgi:vesicle-fusing ATPase
MDLMDSFTSTLLVPSITSVPQLHHALAEMSLFRSQSELERAMGLMQQAGLGQDGRLQVGVKKLVGIVEMCRQEKDSMGDKLVSELVNLQL